jgi:hypothetical protein
MIACTATDMAQPYHKLNTFLQTNMTRKPHVTTRAVNRVPEVWDSTCSSLETSCPLLPATVLAALAKAATAE